MSLSSSAMTGHVGSCVSLRVQEREGWGKKREEKFGGSVFFARQGVNFLVFFARQG